MAEQVRRGREIEQHHSGQRQRDNMVGGGEAAVGGSWHEFDYTWHSCHLCSLRRGSTMDAMSTYGINGGEPRLGNLPAQWTELVGREGALSELSALVWRSRLLTLCGPGGAGKTRLAVALAQAVQADFVDGAWWVDLSATVDSGSVAQVIAAAVAPDAPASESVSGAIARRFADSALLVLTAASGWSAVVPRWSSSCWGARSL
jgi:hypothetical protein